MEGVGLVESKVFQDNRGSFVKLINSHQIKGANFGTLKEVFFSKSHSGVVRGMHLQIGEASSHRIISVLEGLAFDVLLDLRPASSTFLSMKTIILDANLSQSLLVPPGVAHGFQAQRTVTMLYLSDKEYSPQHDLGINPLTLDIAWPEPITGISDRDLALPRLEDFLHL